MRSSLTKGGKGGKKGKCGFVESEVAKQASRETYQGWKRERSSMEYPSKLRDRGFGREVLSPFSRDNQEIMSRGPQVLDMKYREQD